MGPTAAAKQYFFVWWGYVRFWPWPVCLSPLGTCLCRISGVSIPPLHKKEEIHRGRLQREKEALKHLIASAEPSDLILVNEIFSSTSEPEALELSGETLETFHRCRFYCLWNSHHPLHRLSDVPGMCRYAPSAVERYKIRKEECPLAGAQAIAASYGLSGEKLREKWRKRKILLQAKGRDGE